MCKNIVWVTIGVHLGHVNSGEGPFCHIIMTSSHSPHSKHFVRGMNACGPIIRPTRIGFSRRLILG